MPRPQFTLRALLVAMLVVGAFFGGAVFGTKRERQRLEAERAAVKQDREGLQYERMQGQFDWSVNMLEERNDKLKKELHKTMVELIKAEAKAQVNSENANKAAE